jgi:hypothetical protein
MHAKLTALFLSLASCFCATLPGIDRAMQGMIEKNEIAGA